ncbi:hypothetical protein Bca4012_035729 [Brassica carinata]
MDTMMISPLAVLFTTCSICCIFVTSVSVSVPPFPPRDQVEILLAFKNEFPSRNCDESIAPVPHHFDSFSFHAIWQTLQLGIQNLTLLSYIDLSQNDFSGTIPSFLFPMKLEISKNRLVGKVPSLHYNSLLSELDLSSNAFHGSFPVIPPTTIYASNNHFTGDIPLSLCNASGLGRLYLSNNNFSGSIPRCLMSKSLGTLKLHNNNLTGTLPYVEESGLQILDVGHNQISGKLPRSLVNCTRLMFLNVENNRIADTFPFWLKALPDLQIIVLRSNRFHGTLVSSPKSNHPFPALPIVDISHNDFHGSLPTDYFAN